MFDAATGGMDMRLISAQALKEKLDRGDPVKLVNALGDWEYRAAHVPGSLHFATPEETLRKLQAFHQHATAPSRTLRPRRTRLAPPARA